MMTADVTGPEQLSDDDREKLLERAMARHHYAGSSLIEILHAAQQLYRYLPLPLLKIVASKLKLPPSKVLGVATFYHLFRFSPRKTHAVMVCTGTACYVAGAEGLMAAAAEAGRAFCTVEAARCLGSCGLAPVVTFDGEALSRVTVPGLREILTNLDKKA